MSVTFFIKYNENDFWTNPGDFYSPSEHHSQLHWEFGSQTLQKHLRDQSSRHSSYKRQVHDVHSLIFINVISVEELLFRKIIKNKHYMPHSSLVDYLAQVIYAKNCPTTFYCIFQLVWVPKTTTQNIRVCFLSSKKHFFS